MRKSTAQKRKKHSLYVKRRNKKVKSALLVCFSLGLLGVFFLVKSVIAPTVSAFSSGSNDLKDKNIYSVLLVEKDAADLIKSMKLLVIQKKDNKLYSISLSPKIKIDLPGRFGEEEVQKILKLAQTVDTGVAGPDLLVATTKKLLRLNVDRYLIIQTEAYGQIHRAIYNKELKILLPWEFKKVFGDSGTNLSGEEVLDLLIFTRGLDDRNLEDIDLDQVADFGLKVRDITLSGTVSQESLGIVILNGTNKPNVAKDVAQVFQNMGSRISLIDNAENEYEKSYLVTDNPLSATARYIKSYYPGMSVISKDSATSLGEDLLDRGDICVIVGFDIPSLLQ